MIPSILFYYALLIAIGIYGRRRSKTGGDKALDYFLGGRKLGIFPMAMTMAATYVSASSFIGGPGVAYKQGLGWVFLAAVQYPVALLLMGTLGQQLRHLGARRILNSAKMHAAVDSSAEHRLIHRKFGLPVDILCLHNRFLSSRDPSEDHAASETCQNFIMKNEKGFH